jgi:hypothetical protein
MEHEDRPDSSKEAAQQSMQAGEVERVSKPVRMIVDFIAISSNCAQSPRLSWSAYATNLPPHDNFASG